MQSVGIVENRLSVVRFLLCSIVEAVRLDPALPDSAVSSWMTRSVTGVMGNKGDAIEWQLLKQSRAVLTASLNIIPYPVIDQHAYQ